MSTSLTYQNKVLLLDLDGVTVVGERAEDIENIRFLHPELIGLLARKKLDIIVFTHRASGDARHICKALSALGVPILYCVSAREMFLSALIQCRLFELLSGGLSKKYGVAHVLKKHDIGLSGLTLIDDRPEILKEVLQEGVGLGLKAPFSVQKDSFVTFDFSQVFEILDTDIESNPKLLSLDPVVKPFSELPIITSIPKSRATAMSLITRKLFRKTRQLLQKTRG